MAWSRPWCRPCRRSALPPCASAPSSDALLQGGFDEGIEVAVEHLLGRRDLDVGAQVLDAAVVQHVAADLVAPAHVGLAVLELLLLFHALAHLVVVQARSQAL